MNKSCPRSLDLAAGQNFQICYKIGIANDLNRLQLEGPGQARFQRLRITREAALSSTLPPSVRRASDPQHKTWATSDYIGFLRSDNKQKGSEEGEKEGRLALGTMRMRPREALQCRVCNCSLLRQRGELFDYFGGCLLKMPKILISSRGRPNRKTHQL